jgi:serine/threonine-protein kinase
VNVVKGNPRYLAPEQAYGLEADARSDLYSLALTLYEAITGRAPLAARTRAETLALAREPEFPPPSRLRPSVSPALDKVILQALARDPKDRFPTLETFACLLQSSLGEINPSFLPESLDRLLPPVPRLHTLAAQPDPGPARQATADTAVSPAPLARGGTRG